MALQAEGLLQTPHPGDLPGPVQLFLSSSEGRRGAYSEGRGNLREGMRVPERGWRSQRET